jgi:YegS/Rv2252/BmrU family lipid kinase
VGRRRTLVIVNPVAGGGSTGRRWPELRRALDDVLEDWDNDFTLEAGDATRMVREAAADGYDEVVMVGGDGTLNEAVNGLSEVLDAPEGAAAPRLPILGLVRFGTGGDFARHLGLSGRLPQGVAHLARGPIRAFDLGVVEYVDHRGSPARRAFFNIASFGLSGEVDRHVNASRKRLRSASFLLGMGRAMLTYRRADVVIDVDGQAFFRGPMVTVAVANGTHFGGGMKIARDAQPDDGVFDVVVQQRAGLPEFARLPELYDGRIADWTTVATARGALVTARPTDPGLEVLLDIDGEQLGRLPATFRIRPGAVKLRVP